MTEDGIDSQTIDEIARFKDAVEEPEDASESEEEFIGPTYTNRGKKLKHDAREVYQGKLGANPAEGHGVKVVQFDNKKRAVIYKKRKANEMLDDEEKEQEELYGNDEDGDEVDPYDEVKLGDLLTPVGHPSELPTHPALSRTYQSDTITNLASRALDIVCEEQKHAVQFSKLMSIFLGDDPSYARVNKMNLPIYDHLSENTDSNNNINNTTTTDGSTITKTGTDDGVKGEYEDDRRVTRKQVSQEMDPFFALPQINIDRDFGLSAESAEESRQLAQIALQRSEEFIRCMTDVRMGLLKANRRKHMVYGWCKDMATQREKEEEAAAAEAAVATAAMASQNKNAIESSNERRHDEQSQS